MEDQFQSFVIQGTDIAFPGARLLFTLLGKRWKKVQTFLGGTIVVGWAFVNEILT